MLRLYDEFPQMIKIIYIKYIQNSALVMNNNSN